MFPSIVIIIVMFNGHIAEHFMKIPQSLCEWMFVLFLFTIQKEKKSLLISVVDRIIELQISPFPNTWDLYLPYMVKGTL